MRPPLPTAGDRYERLDLLGAGGMGVVWRVRDRALNRVMAMKVIRPELMVHAATLARFVEEAQCSAQLQHPGIVPVHELGRLDTGELYITMREVRGRALGEVIREVHAVAGPDRWQARPSGWTFRRLVGALHRACEAMGYAHGRGVIHRDLKPDNILLGEHGEVLVVDWGLAKVVGVAGGRGGPGDPSGEAVVTARSGAGGLVTRLGAVAGTPVYMPPEQARGENHAVDARSDVYALGAVLYQVLTGATPYAGDSADDVLADVIAGPPPPLDPARPGPPLPVELVAACERAMSRDPAHRPAHAGELAVAIGEWLEGARRRENALAVVAAARAAAPEAEALRARADALRAEAAALLNGVEEWAPESRKAPGWALEDEATALDRQIGSIELDVHRRLLGALQVDPTLPEAHAALAERALADHAAAEASRDADAALRAERALAEHGAALPEGHPTRAGCAAYLRGDGALTLVTDPPGAEVLLHRYEVHRRRLVPVYQRSLGRTPLVRVALPMGSYLCVLRHPDRAEVRYPVHVGRQEHFDGSGPDGGYAVHLPRAGELGPDDRYVPGGWFLSGGDAEASEALPARRLWCDGFVMRRTPVTNGEYLAFLDTLVAAGREDDALRWVPRERSGQAGDEGAVIYGRDAAGRFVLRPDADGDVWEPAFPVLQVHLGCAVAYARWSAAEGRAWRLPGELEWEKAARGVDGRAFPWGDTIDPAWCRYRASVPGRPTPGRVGATPVDDSPYGIRDLGGNAQDWCADPFRRDGPELDGVRVVPPPLPDVDPTSTTRWAYRGGAWYGSERLVRSANRYATFAGNRTPMLSFRLVRSLG